jgi:hypothetical protein
MLRIAKIALHKGFVIVVVVVAYQAAFVSYWGLKGAAFEGCLGAPDSAVHDWEGQPST